MIREKIEDKINIIINNSKNKNLKNLLKNIISTFNENELQKILEFLEIGDEKIILEFIQEKIKNLKGKIETIKILKGKINIGNNIKKEKKEKQEEKIKLENLLNQL